MLVCFHSARCSFYVRIVQNRGFACETPIPFHKELKIVKSMEFSESLKKNKDFRTVYQKGKSYGNKYLVLYLLRNESGRNRVGISVSKKTGNSVVRHRLTRLIRESYRLNEKKFDDGLDLVVIARPGAKEKSFFEIESALLHLARKQKILREHREPSWS